MTKEDDQKLSDLCATKELQDLFYGLPPEFIMAIVFNGTRVNKKGKPMVELGIKLKKIVRI